MRDHTDSDLTLPSVVAALPGTHREEALALTVVFHSDVSRIGDTALLPDSGGPWTLGRLGPLFAGVDPENDKPLEERHVSRQAVQLCWQGCSLEVVKVSGSSRARLDGVELAEPVVLSRDQLCRGVPIMLGHAVVLLLRFGPPAPRRTGDQRHGDLFQGHSGHMIYLREQIRQVADSDLDVLIRGETGTGKELVATAIHRASRRADSPLISLNMSAIPTGLAAASLFGSAKGAYTGADRPGRGYFEQAEGGSLFLDEIGDTPSEIQPQLLRALQQREIQSVGGPVKRVDLRVISATDADLENPSCDFKSALRHRLSTSEIHLLPLREHPEDLGELLWYFLAAAATELERKEILPGEGSTDREIGAWAELFHRFLTFTWPGNVRELSNLARQVMLASKTGLVVPPTVMVALDRDSAIDERVDPGDQTPDKRSMQEVGEDEFDRAMEDNCFEARPAARQLRVSRPSVYRRIEDSPRYHLAAQIPLEDLGQALKDNGGDARAAALQLRVSPSALRTRLRNSDLDWH